MKVPSFQSVCDYEVNDVHSCPSILLLNIAHDYMMYLNGTEDREFDGKVTVLIPCYGKAGYVKKAVQSCVNQTVPVKVIVRLMDKESQALAPELEAMGDIECHCEERLDVTKARTWLVGKCPTDWFIFLDADDELAPNYVEVLAKQKGAARYSGCRFEENQKTHSPLRDVAENNISNIIVYNNTAMYHKDVFYDIGYDDSLSAGGEDTDFNLRLVGKRRWLLSYTTDTYFIYRIESENQLTKSSKFYDSNLRCFIKNKDILLEGLHKSVKEFKTIKDVKWVIENLSEDNLLAFLDARHFSGINLKARFDRLCAHVYYKYLNKSSQNKTLIKLHGGRVKSLEDLLYKSSFIDPMLVELPANLDPIGKLFYVLENFKCCENGDIYYGNVHYVEDKNFFDYIKPYNFPSEIEKFVKMWRTRGVINSEGKDLQKISFVFNRTCNANCKYCFQREQKDYPILSDDELYANFDKALTKFEKLTNGNVYPQILGGEPTLMSDYLIQKIADRLKDYKQILIFTNGIKKDSLWYKLENVRFDIHVLNWTDPNLKLEAKHGYFYTYVVSKNEIDKVEDFLKKIKTDGAVAYINPCKSENPEINTTWEDRCRLASIVSKYQQDCLAELFSGKYTKKELQTKCRENKGVWDYDVITDTVRPCCGYCNGEFPQNIPLNDFDGTQKAPDCKDCMEFGNML